MTTRWLTRPVLLATTAPFAHECTKQRIVADGVEAHVPGHRRMWRTVSEDHAWLDRLRRTGG
jgi:hypothetical protein